jgi:aminopeptidase N
MNPWTQLKGYPVVNITRISSKQINVSQQRFVINSEEDINNEPYLWPISLSYFSANSSGNYLIKPNTKTGTIVLKTEIPLNSWIKFNDEESGFYLVNYQERDWNLLIGVLKTNRRALSPTNRANLIFDASLLAERGFVSYESLFDLLSYLKDEDNLIPWMTAYTSLIRLNCILSSSRGGLPMKKFTKDLTQKLYKTLGWGNREKNVESFQDK